MSQMTDRRCKPLIHGTVGGYQRCRPACDACKTAWNDYYARYRQTHPREGADPGRRTAALEALAARHPSEFLALYEKAAIR